MPYTHTQTGLLPAGRPGECVHMCLCVCVHVLVCACMCLTLCVHICMCMYVLEYKCVCVCVVRRLVETGKNSFRSQPLGQLFSLAPRLWPAGAWWVGGCVCVVG